MCRRLGLLGKGLRILQVLVVSFFLFGLVPPDEDDAAQEWEKNEHEDGVQRIVGNATFAATRIDDAESRVQIRSNCVCLCDKESTSGIGSGR